MSHEGISIALGDKVLTGELRLAYMAVGDCTGVVSISSVISWCNCNEARAENLVDQLIDANYLHVADDCIISYAMQREEYGDTPKPHGNQTHVAKTIRQQIYERDGHKCHYCQSTENLTLDHIIPRSNNGNNSPENLVTCCQSCNSSKGVKSYDEFVFWRAGFRHG